MRQLSVRYIASQGFAQNRAVRSRSGASIVLTFVFAFIVFLCQPVVVCAAKDITVGSFPFLPLISTGSGGVTSGINADLIEQVAK